jgi:hypothetical protein
MCSWIVSDKWYTDRKTDVEADSKRIVKAAARLIASEIRDMASNMDKYPTASEIADEDCHFTPPLLTLLMQSLIASKVKQAALGQAIVQASRPRTIITPLLLGLAVEMDHVYASEFLIAELYSLGFSLSYDEVRRYKHSVLSAVSTNNDDVQNDVGYAFTQWVADNLDHNSRTLDGLGTFHGMGIISASVCRTVHDTLADTPILRLKNRLSAVDIAKITSIPIMAYDNISGGGLSVLRLQPVSSIRQHVQQFFAPPALELNLVWHAASLFSSVDFKLVLDDNLLTTFPNSCACCQ